MPIMSPYPSLPAGARGAARAPLSNAAATLLRGASRLLERLAERLCAQPAACAPTTHAHVEFHAEAGAPEGALYADGVLLGMLPGVKRL
jgi:hypothetical protein